jgi:ribosome-associated protein
MSAFIVLSYQAMKMSHVIKEIRFSAIRSRGPGGPNVNKVSSAALLNWDFEYSSALNDEEKSLVRERLAHAINRDGAIYIRADEFRDLERNKARCIEKLEARLVKALHKPKKRRTTKPTLASRKRNREAKARRGEIKRGRQKVNWD